MTKKEAMTCPGLQSKYQRESSQYHHYLLNIAESEKHIGKPKTGG